MDKLIFLRFSFALCFLNAYESYSLLPLPSVSSKTFCTRSLKSTSGFQIQNVGRHPDQNQMTKGLHIQNRGNMLTVLKEKGRSGADVADQVFKEFDQAVEINDLLLVEDLVLVIPQI